MARVAIIIGAAVVLVGGLAVASTSIASVSTVGLPGSVERMARGDTGGLLGEDSLRAHAPRGAGGTLELNDALGGRTLAPRGGR